MFIFNSCSTEVDDSLDLPEAETSLQDGKVRFVKESSISFLSKERNQYFPDDQEKSSISDIFSINRNSVMEVKDEAGNKT